MARRWKTVRIVGMLWWRQGRERFRQNPGFVTAAVSGSLGLILALLMLIHGGVRLLFAGDSPKKSSEIHRSSIVREDDDGAFMVSKPAAKPAKKKQTLVEAEPGDEPIQFEPVAKKSRPMVEDDVAEEKHSRDDEPFLSEPVVRKPAKPSKVEAIPEEVEHVEHDDVPILGKGLTSPVLRKPAKPEEEDPVEEPIVAREKAKSRTDVVPFGDDAAEPADDDQPMIEPVANSTESVVKKKPKIFDPDANKKPAESDDDALIQTPTEKAPATAQPKRWNNSKGKPSVPNDAIPQQHDPVETVIHAVQEPKRRPSPPARLPDDNFAPPAKPRTPVAGDLRLRIASPVNSSVGRTTTLDVVVTNCAPQPAANVVLSVELPPGLEHDKGRSLECRISSLASGESRRVPLVVRAVQPGTAPIQGTAESANRGIVQAAANLEIIADRTASNRGPAGDCCLPVQASAAPACSICR